MAHHRALTTLSAHLVSTDVVPGVCSLYRDSTGLILSRSGGAICFQTGKITLLDR